MRKPTAFQSILNSIIANIWQLQTEITVRGTSLAVQRLRLCASAAGGKGSVPGQGAKILHAHAAQQKKTHTHTHKTNKKTVSIKNSEHNKNIIICGNMK